MQSIRYPGFVFMHENIICQRHRSWLQGPAPSAEHTNRETLGARVESCSRSRAAYAPRDPVPDEHGVSETRPRGSPEPGCGRRDGGMAGECDLGFGRPHQCHWSCETRAWGQEQCLGPFDLILYCFDTNHLIYLCIECCFIFSPSCNSNFIYGFLFQTSSMQNRACGKVLGIASLLQQRGWLCSRLSPVWVFLPFPESSPCPATVPLLLLCLHRPPRAAAQRSSVPRL